MLDTLLKDARYALRSLRAAPAFAVVGIASLGLGIGASGAIFGLFDAVVLNPVPGVEAADRVVEVRDVGFSYPAYLDFRERSRAFQDVVAYGYRTLNVRRESGAELVESGVVSGNFFRVLGVAPAVGRTLTLADDRPGAPLAAMLGHAAWRDDYGGDPGVVGRTIALNGRDFTIVGVAPAGFRGVKLGVSPKVWLPIEAWGAVKAGPYANLDIRNRGWSWLRVAGRLGPGVTVAAAGEDLRSVRRWQLETYPQSTRDVGALDVVPVAASAAGFADAEAVDRFVGMLMAAVALALAIACANLANLLLARGERRRHELGVRMALGAGRRRVVRQLMTESVILAAAGALVGLFVATWGLRILAGIELPGGLGVDTLGVELDARVVAFAVAVAALTALAFGLVPALRSSSMRATAALHRRGATAGPRGTTLRSVLVTVQVALCLALLAGAGLFLRSVSEAMAVDLGFEAERLGSVRVELALQGYDADRSAAFIRQLEERVEASPEVVSAAWAGDAPLAPGRDNESFQLAGYTPAPDENLVTAVSVVGAEYFRTAGIPLIRGRGFTEAETFADPPAVVVDEPFVERYFGGRDPVGETITMRGAPLTVVGVVPTIVHRDVAERPVPYVYVSRIGAGLPRGMSLVVRARADVAPALRVALDEARALDPDLPVETEAVRDRLARIIMPQRVAATFFGLFSVLTLVLAATGIYGVITYIVSARTREFGIRLALGARPATVIRLVARRGLVPVVAGLALGTGLALAGGRAVSALLFGVEPGDPATLAVVATLLAAIALVASVVPALRAGRVDPARVLREE